MHIETQVYKHTKMKILQKKETQVYHVTFSWIKLDEYQYINRIPIHKNQKDIKSKDGYISVYELKWIPLSKCNDTIFQTYSFQLVPDIFLHLQISQ